MEVVGVDELKESMKKINYYCVLELRCFCWLGWEAQISNWKSTGWVSWNRIRTDLLVTYAIFNLNILEIATSQ